MMADDDPVFRQYAEAKTRGELKDVLAELRKQVVDVLYPHPDQVRRRISLITRYANERHMARYFRAYIQAQALQAIRDRRKVDWLAVIERYPQELVSLKGLGRKEAVEIARWVQPQAPKGRGILGWVTGR